MNKYKLYVVSHTHWDRDWYGSFQLFRLRLVRLMNKLLALLEADPDYVSFNLDGQTVLLDDYLEVHPEQRETLEQHVRAGRLMVGPWYMLPDEFLSGGESIVRNLLLGDRMSNEFGHRMEVGYIPDTFGHIAQLPQILQGFGLDTCMNFRGLDSGDRQSELWWESPNGSRVLLHHMSTIIGYSDLGAMANDPQRAAYDLRATAYYKAERATGNVLLAMQGVDHAEARKDLTEIVGIANDTFDDVEFIHGTLEDFWQDLKQSVASADLETVVGELRDVPRTDGSMNFLLYNVLSSRVDNKLQNAKTLIALEQWAEPWCSIAAMWGIEPYPHGHLWTAWKWLLKNHPHDSIGGCSVDAVHRQMNTRFEWAREIAESLTEERFRLLAEQVDCSDANTDEVAVMVFNATPWERKEVVTIDIDIPEYWLRQQALENYQPAKTISPDSHFLDVKDVNTREDWLYGSPQLPEVFFRSIRLRTETGEEVPLQIHNMQTVVQAIALASGPRGVQDVRRIRASFAASVPAYGYSTYYVKTDPNPNRYKARSLPTHTLENEYLRVQVNPNGSFNLRVNGDAQGVEYKNLGLLVDSGDNGDGYTFSPPQYNCVYSTATASPRISGVGTGIGLQQIRIEYNFELPSGLDDVRQRRVDEMVVCPVIVDLILRDGSLRLEIMVKVDNRAKDHRLQMRFPTPYVDATEASSAMQFDVMTRPITPQPIDPQDWWVEDPSTTFPMHGWMDICAGDQSSGLCVMAEGLHEFGIDPQTDSMDVSLTLLRAVGYLGARQDLTTIITGAGPGIATPEAQLQQTLQFRLALFPHPGDWEAGAVWRQAQAFLTPPKALTIVPHAGHLPPKQWGIELKGECVVLSSIKQAEDGVGVIVRVFNPTQHRSTAQIALPIPIIEAWQVNLREEAQYELSIEQEGRVLCDVPAKTIVTLKLITN